MKQRYKIISRLLRGIVWGSVSLIAIAFILLYFLSRGVPGSWFSTYLSAIPADVGVLEIDRVAFDVKRGFTLRGIRFFLPDTPQPFASCQELTVGFDTFSTKPIPERLRSLRLIKPYVARIQYTDTPEVLSVEATPFPDLSEFHVPVFKRTSIELVDADILELQADHVKGTFYTAPDHSLVLVDAVAKLKSKIKAYPEEITASYLILDIRKSFLKTHLIGTVSPQSILGVYRALDFPIIEAYSNNFNLSRPIHADTTFTVGLNTAMELFHFVIDIQSNGSGTYCDVPFDSFKGRITVDGVNHAITRIDPIIVSRKGKPALTGSLIFDCDKDRFTFNADSLGLSTEECLKAIDMPFTQVIPSCVTQRPPHLSFTGYMPFYRRTPRPGDVVLQGRVFAESSGTIADVPFDHLEMKLSMANSVLQLSDIQVKMNEHNAFTGKASLKIHNVDDPQHIDFDISAHMDAVPLKSFNAYMDTSEVLPHEMSLSGTCQVTGRTDETLLASLKGSADLNLHGELIKRLSIFGGLTDAFASYIPGIKAISDSSDAKSSIAFEGGVLTVKSFQLTGDLFEIEGEGTYNYVDDTLAMKGLATGFKKGSFMGDITRWVSQPMSHLLAEFTVTGSIKDPKWKHQGIINKIFTGLKTIPGVGKIFDPETFKFNSTPPPTKESL